MFKPVQFFGSLPIRPSSSEGKVGGAVQFVIPGLKVGGEERARFQDLGFACGDVEAVRLDRAVSEPGKHPCTFVTITFHVKESPTSQQDADSVGRLIAERFLSLASFAIGERLTGRHQQVSVSKGGGAYSVGLHPQRKWADEPRAISLDPSLCAARPSEDTFKALFWLRRGLSDRDPLDAFAALVVSLEILSSVLLDPESLVSRCPQCQAETGKRTTASVKRLVVEVLGGTPELFKRLWDARNAVVAHGSRSVTADVLLEVVELRFDAIQLVFKALATALNLSPKTAPRPSPIVMVADPFLSAE